MEPGWNDAVEKRSSRGLGHHKGMICYRSLFPTRPIARSIVQKCANDDAPERKRERKREREKERVTRAKKQTKTRETLSIVSHRMHGVQALNYPCDGREEPDASP